MRTIFHENLQRRYLCATWIPHALTEQQKKLRVTSAKSIRHHLANLSNKSRLYAVQDETWIPFSVTRRTSQNKAWVALGEQKPTVVKEKLTNQKTMLVLMFTANKKFSIYTTGKGETFDSSSFVNFLSATGTKWRNLRSDPTRLEELTVQFDNARPHTSMITKSFLERRKVTQVWQAPYSPDLNLCDRWLFEKLKTGLVDMEFKDHQEVEEAVLQVLKEIPQSEFDKQLEKLFVHCQRIIDEGGDYISEF